MLGKLKYLLKRNKDSATVKQMLSLYRVAQAYLNQKKLDAEAKQLQHSATNFAKQTQSWLNLVEAFSSALKEIGDAENWARSIEGDMRTIATALEYSYKGKQSVQTFVLMYTYRNN